VSPHSNGVNRFEVFARALLSDRRGRPVRQDAARPRLTPGRCSEPCFSWQIPRFNSVPPPGIQRSLSLEVGHASEEAIFLHECACFVEELLSSGVVSGRCLRADNDAVITKGPSGPKPLTRTRTCDLLAIPLFHLGVSG